MASTIEVRPSFNSEAAEIGYHLLLTQHPHIEPIVEAVNRATRTERSLREDRIQEREELRHAHDEEVRQIWHIERAWDNGEKILAADEQRVERRRAKIAKIKRRMAELSAIQPAPFFGMDVLNSCFAVVREWHRFESVQPNTPDDENKAAKELEKERTARTKLLRSGRDLELGALPLESAVAKMRAEVDKLVSDGTPNTSALFRMVRNASGDRRSQGGIRFRNHIPPGGSDLRPDPWTFIFWACQDEIKAKFEAMLRAEAANHGQTIPWQDRGPMLAEIREKVKAHEYREAALVNFLASRSDAQHRPDSDPLAVLLLKRLPDAEHLHSKAAYDVAEGGPTYGSPLSAAESSGWHASAGGRK